jgi:hypothetical protein
MKGTDTTYSSRRFLDEHDKTDVNYIATSVYHQKGYSSVDISLHDCVFGWVIKDKEDVSKALRCIAALEEELAKLRKEVSCMKPEDRDLTSGEA